MNTVLFDRIKNLSSQESQDIFVNLGYLVEEVGEISRTLLEDNGFKSKKNKEKAKDECVDALICILSLYLKTGGNLENELFVKLDKKIDKWEKNLSKRKKIH